MSKAHTTIYGTTIVGFSEPERGTFELELTGKITGTLHAKVWTDGVSYQLTSYNEESVPCSFLVINKIPYQGRVHITNDFGIGAASSVNRQDRGYTWAWNQRQMSEAARDVLYAFLLSLTQHLLTPDRVAWAKYQEAAERSVRAWEERDQADDRCRLREADRQAAQEAYYDTPNTPIEF